MTALDRGGPCKLVSAFASIARERLSSGNNGRVSPPIGVAVGWCDVPNGIYHDGAEVATAQHRRVEPIGVDSLALIRFLHLTQRDVLATFPVCFQLAARVSVLQALHTPTYGTYQQDLMTG